MHIELHISRAPQGTKTLLGARSRELLAENGGFEQPFAHVLLGELAVNRAV